MDKQVDRTFKDVITKETKYCKLLESVKMYDKETGYTYAFEKIYVKDLKREEIRMCLYKDMLDRAGKTQNRMLVRPVDLTELEFVQLFKLAYDKNLFSEECKKYLSNIINKK